MANYVDYHGLDGKGAGVWVQIHGLDATGDVFVVTAKRELAGGFVEESAIRFTAASNTADVIGMCRAVSRDGPGLLPVLADAIEDDGDRVVQSGLPVEWLLGVLRRPILTFGSRDGRVASGNIATRPSEH